ncbi:MAG: SOS response-associated peptidase [Actinobacteria bacterium]|nr:SOS response-associated peptidase [Actinomycetota bacterium]
MCGRYAAAKDPAALAEEFGVAVPPEPLLEPDYNVAPTKRVYVVVEREQETGPRRELAVARWGLIPSWAKDPSIGSRLINARAETVAEKPSFRGAFAKRRCLVPADGYFEWYVPTPLEAKESPAGKVGKPVKQPFFIHAADGSSLAMAGLYEWWRDPSREEADPLAWRLTCTILTTDASDEVGRIHDRMPMTIPREDWAVWLDPATAGPRASELLRPPTGPGLEAYPVSVAVNSVRNNSPELIIPLAAEDLIPNG